MRILKGMEDHLLKEQVDRLRFLVLRKNSVAREMTETITTESIKNNGGEGLFP